MKRVSTFVSESFDEMGCGKMTFSLHICRCCCRADRSTGELC